MIIAMVMMMMMTMMISNEITIMMMVSYSGSCIRLLWKQWGPMKPEF